MIKRKQQQTRSPDNDSGFTIIESLVAIVVVAILMAAITPVLVMSTSIRVQSRRVELSAQAAKSFIDGVRNGSVAAPSAVSTLSLATTTSPRNINSSPGDYLISTTEMPAPTSATGLYCLRKDSVISNISTDCSNISNINFYVQAGRIVQSTGTNDGYRMAIRVYRSDIDFTKTVKISTGTTKQTASSVSGSLGDKQAPLIEMTTDVGNSSTSFQALCQRLGTPLITPTPTATSTPSPTPVPCG